MTNADHTKHLEFVTIASGHEPAAGLPIDRGDIEYRIWPSDQATDSESLPTLTLLHEGLGCVTLWRDFPERLAEMSGLPVMAYSRFGYGHSSQASLPRSMNYMHDEARIHLPALLDALKIKRTVLIGHSDGASIAAINAGDIDDSRIEGVVLMSPHFFCEDKILNSIANARTQWQTGMLRMQLVRYHGDNVDCAFEGWNGAWMSPAFRDWNIEDSLVRVSVPVLGIQREEDPYGSDRQLQVICDSDHSNREIHFIDGTGHAPHQERPEQTLALIRDFLTRYKIMGNT